MEAENHSRRAKENGRGSVARVYRKLKEMAIHYEFRPGERLNEVDLAAQLKTSRTPLREALNRLTMEGFLIFKDKPGFYCRPLTASDVCDLYECRTAIEKQAVRLAVERASDTDIEALWALLVEGEESSAALNADELLQQDEHFHQGIADLSGNKELVRFLANINDRIHFIRSIKRDERRAEAEAEHHAIATALMNRNAGKAETLMEDHISRRREDIVEAIRIGVAHIYMRGAEQ